MRAYVAEGKPKEMKALLEELEAIQGVIIHKVHEHGNVVPGIGKRVDFIQIIFFAIDDEVANYLALKFPPNIFRSTEP
jgi:hypothetical protein